MRRRMITILASAVLAGSLLATGAQARGGGGGGHMGGFGRGHIVGLGGGQAVAHVDHEHFGMGRRRFDSGIYDPVGPDCPNDTPYPTPYTCTL
jgi:hypothetical protein